MSTSSVSSPISLKSSTQSRRDFLRSGYRSAAMVVVGSLTIPTLFAACSDDITEPSVVGPLNLATDIGVLGYLYTLLQLKSDFFTRVTSNRYPGMTTAESSAFSTIAAHTTAACTFLSTNFQGIPISRTIPFTFRDSVDFGTRISVTTHAQRIADTIAQSFPQLISRFQRLDYVSLFVKFSSLAERHAVTLRDLAEIASGNVTGTTFAGSDLLAPDGLEAALSPTEVIQTLADYFVTSPTLLNA